ncbi:MAG: LLM class F420-dependent oxidoreductase [Dehalococcoidia bacterium]
MSGRPIEFGIQTGPQHATFDEILAIWRTAEEAGFDHAWTFDHFIPIFSDPEGPCLEGWTTLTALMAQVPRLRGGTLVTGNSYRNPALLANIAATLDVITGGRVEMGIGAGWWEMEYHAYGYDYPHVAARIRALEESVQILKRLWTEHRATFEGRSYTIKDALCEPKPVQEPHIPIWVGGAGPQLTLRVVARHADGWNTFLAPREDYRLLVAALERHCENAGRDPASVRRSLAGQLVISATAAEAQQKLERVAQQRRMTVEQARDRAFIGTPDDIANQLAGLAEQGVDHIILSLRAPYPHDDLRLFASEVIPKVRAAGY